MRSQLPEHALITLLRQCFITPRCQAPRNCQRKISRSSRRELHTSRARQYLQLRRSSTLEKQRRLHQTSSRLTETEIPFTRKSNSDFEARGTSQVQLNLSQPHKQQSSTVGNQNRERHSTRIAVLGGGITGLASAHYLTRELPNAKITLYEGSDRLGGWLRSKQINIGNGTVVFEQGPRTLRPSTSAAMVTLDMIKALTEEGYLKDALLTTSKSSVAAQNRFIYYPDHLVRMPGPGQDLYTMLWSLATEPIFNGLITSGLFEFNRPPRPEDLEDESVGSFFERRLGSPNLGNNVVSAGLHGIYAGDLYQLSIKSLIPRLWHQEGVYGSITRGLLESLTTQTISLPFRDAMLQNEMVEKLKGPLLESMADATVYTFKKGIGQLSGALEKSLQKNKNVDFKMGYKIKDIEYDTASDGITIKTTQNQPSSKYTHAISTVSARVLSNLTSNTVPSLAATHAVTVMVVNLYYADSDILPERGFGYLIPRSISFDQNPECALGVVFDSDATSGQDSVPGTKVTVMLGGHWWDGFDSYPDEEEGAAMAKALLKRHLKIEVEPKLVNVALQRECIPQYTVGHEERMKKAHGELMSAFKGKLTVAGNSYTGVGLNDCVRAARDAVLGIKKGDDNTGLEEFAGPRGWVDTKLPSRSELEKEFERRQPRE